MGATDAASVFTIAEAFAVNETLFAEGYKSAEDGTDAKDICAQVADLAEMARQPLVADRMVEFLRRSNALLTKVIAK